MIEAASQTDTEHRHWFRARAPGRLSLSSSVCCILN